MAKMIVVSGLSGAGKTVALNTLEDIGYYCIDNMLMSLLPALVREQANLNKDMAVGIDIRNTFANIDKLPEIIDAMKEYSHDFKLLFLDSSDDVLIKRFSETRRKHPLTSEKLTLVDAIAIERKSLSFLSVIADYHIDTSHLSIYDLKERLKNWLNIDVSQQTSVVIESFGFKKGVPLNADIVFDVRFLINPYWEPNLRNLNGKDKLIANFLTQQPQTQQFIDDVAEFLAKWIPSYLDNRTYLTIAVGCTGGKHRSVFISEQLFALLVKKFNFILLRHRDLNSQHSVG